MASSVSEQSHDDEKRISKSSGGGADSGVSEIPQEEVAAMKSN